MKTCLHCKKERIETIRKRFCTIECAREYQRDYMNRRNAEERKVLKELTCKQCSKTFQALDKRKQFCSKECKNNSRKTKWKENYGVENPSQLPEVRAKRAETTAKMLKTRDEVQMQTTRRATMLERYGYTNAFNSENSKKNRKEKLKTKYAAASPRLVPFIAFGNKNTIKEVDSDIIQYIEKGKVNPFSQAVKAYVKKTYGASYQLIAGALKRESREDLVKTTQSTQEDEIYSHLRACYGGIIKRGDKEVLTPSNFAEHLPDRDYKYPLELDLYLPELKIAIEYNGLYWHSELNSASKHKHQDKFLLCEKLGIRLFTLFENQWSERPAQTKQFLENLVSSKKRLYARACTVISDSDKIKNFIKANHLQGLSRASAYYALEYKGAIVMAISIGHNSRNSKDAVKVLNRVCFSKYSVVGGLERLLKAQQEELLVTFSDNTYAPLPTLYTNAKFSLVSDTSLPDYFLYDGTARTKSKFSTKDLAKTRPAGTSIKEWEQAHGFWRVWDCGKRKWKWTRN